jgi:beta-fructofuranosidase
MWQKSSRNPILRADARWYETDFFWRDPFVFWNEEAKQYWMLLGARVNTGPTTRRACTGLAVSPDLEHWEVHPPFWSPYLYDHPHECPELYRWGDRWVLLFSTHGFARYRVSDSLNGPWRAPACDNLGPFFYPAKITSDETRHLVFGWNPTRAGETDGGAREWGGHMVVQEVRLGQQDAIAVGPAREIDRLFSEPQPLAFQPRLGEWETDGSTSFAASRTDGLAFSTLGEMPNPCRISLTMICSFDTRACGVLLRARPDLEEYYQLCWEPGRGRVTYRRWRRQFPYDDDSLAAQPLLTPEGRSMELIIHIEDTNVVAYINNTVALTCRAYDYRTGQLGLFVESGEARFANVAMSCIPADRE